MPGLDVRVVHIADCPSWERAMARTRAALESVGTPEVTVSDVLVRTPAQAARAGFAGSPTILIDGADPFPAGGPASALACRLYATPDGLDGAPTTAQIASVLRARR